MRGVPCKDSDYPFTKVGITRELRFLPKTELAKKYHLPFDIFNYALKRWKLRSPHRGNAGKRGAESARWKGNNVCYYQFHLRVKRLYGTPKQCNVCFTTDLSKTYDWANLTGHYGDINDFKRMCRSCHTRYDFSRGLRSTKLTPKQVVAIRAFHQRGITQAYLATTHHVDPSAISQIIRRKAWTYV